VIWLWYARAVRRGRSAEGDRLGLLIFWSRLAQGKIMSRSWNSLTFSLAVLLMAGAARGSLGSEPPYPASPVIAKLTWDDAVVQCGREGSGDNWPMAWVDDDLYITSWGDGPGFEGPTAREARLSLGFARIYGDPPSLRGEDFATSVDTPEGSGSSGIKASGLLMVDGILYMFVRNYKPPGSEDFTNARLAWSRDAGVHWQWADWHFADTFGCPEFVQFGKNYQGARDRYVYIASQANDSAYGFAPDIVMARAPKDRVADRDAYEFFAGLDESGQPRWSAEIAERAPIFHDPHGTQRVAITYNAALKRYILTTSHLPPGVEATHTAALGVFDAPEPWGPWTTLYYDDHWSVVDGKDCRTYHHKFPTKWMSADGKEMWLLYSGLDGGLYEFCVKKVKLEVRRPDGSEGSVGLATKYLGEAGIENDPAVVFVEGFEEGNLDAVGKRWDSAENKGIMSLSPDVPPGSGGTHSLLMSHVGGKSNGGNLYRRLLPGYDKLYVRFYVKFDPDCAPIHHFVHVGGYNPPTPWAQGGAGIRPTGDERFTTGVEPYANKWRWDFYSYWMDMRSSPDGKSWGHDFLNDPALQAVRGQWTCVELMMKMNDPVTQSNGEQALWIDGRPWEKNGQVVSHLGAGFPRGKWTWDSFHSDPNGTPFEGFRWRSTPDLKLNFLWLLLYITDAPLGHVSKVWFDNIVVARAYIGPIHTVNLR
jgi:hypothetical protein